MRGSLAVGVAGGFLALHLLPLAGLVPCAWGVDAPASLPVAACAAFFGLGAVALLPPVRARLAAGLVRLARGGSLTAALILAAAVALFVGARSAVPLLGDGQLHLADLQRLAADGTPFREIRWANNNSPLANAVVYALLHAVQGVSPAGTDIALRTFRILSVTSGVLYVLLARDAARRIGQDAVERSVVLAFLLTAGYVQLFAGYVEYYAPLAVLVLAFVVLAAVAAERQRMPWEAALVLGVAIAYHISAATLVPALAVAGAASGKGPGSRAAAAGGVTVFAGAVALVLFRALGFDPIAAVRSPEVSHLLPVFAAPGYRQAYRLFDVRHAVDLLWQYLLVTPGAVLGIAMMRRGAESADTRVLPVAAAVPVLFTVVVNPEVGAFRDWDALAFAAVPLTVWAAVRVARAGADALRATMPVLAVAALHTAAWLASNADAPAAEARFERLLAHCPVSRHGQAYGQESLGSLYAREGRATDAASALDRAVAAAPEIPRLWNLAGTRHLAAGNAARAEQCFMEAVVRDSTFAESWLGLGTLRLAANDPRRAAQCFAHAVAARPDLAEAWLNLGLAAEALGEPDRAARCFGNAVEHGPGLAPAWYHLARLYVAQGRIGESRAAAARFVALAPTDPRATEARLWMQVAARAGATPQRPLE